MNRGKSEIVELVDCHRLFTRAVLNLFATFKNGKLEKAVVRESAISYYRLKNETQSEL